MSASRAELLAKLRDQVAQIEKKPALAGFQQDKAAEVTRRLEHPAGALHEIYADKTIDAGAMSGFTLAMASSLVTKTRRAVFVLQLRSAAPEIGLIYAPGLAPTGITNDELVIGQMESVVDLLWAIEEAAACRSVAAVIADIQRPSKALDFTASRRLTMRSSENGCSIFLTRYGSGRPATAAPYRWSVKPSPSGPLPFDDRAPGNPRWAVELERGRLPNLAQGKKAVVEFDQGLTLVGKDVTLAPKAYARQERRSA